jgi:hypothetical protein
LFTKQNIPATILALIILCGCGLTGKETTPPSAGLYIINASPDAPPIDLALNNNTIASAYPYGKDSGYFLAFPELYEFKLQQTGASSYLTDQFLKLRPGGYYSLFLVDYYNALKILFIEDKLTTDTFSVAKVRFFDFCPNSPRLDAAFTNDIDTLNFKGRSFNDQGTLSGRTAFTSTPAGVYNLSLYKQDTTILIKGFTGFNFESGKQYTVYLRGLNENAVTPLEAATIRH